MRAFPSFLIFSPRDMLTKLWNICQNINRKYIPDLRTKMSSKEINTFKEFISNMGVFIWGTIVVGVILWYLLTLFGFFGNSTVPEDIPADYQPDYGRLGN